MIQLVIDKSRMNKRGNSIYITVPKDTDDEELLGTQLSTLPKIRELGYNHFEVPIRYFWKY